MNRSLRRLAFWPLLGVLIAGTSCTFKLAYDYADWLILWQLDHYFDLTHEQKNVLSARLDTLLTHHRAEALPKYAAFIVLLSETCEDGLTGEEVDGFFASYTALRTELFELVAEDGTRFLGSVDERQLQYLEDRLQRDNQEIEEHLQDPPDKRLAKRAERTVEWVEDWLGSLTTVQEQRITGLSMALPDTFPVWVEYRRARQHALLEILRGSGDPRELSGPWREWLLNTESAAPPNYLRSRELMQQEVKLMVLSIDRLMTPQQRGHLLSELHEIIEDLQDLAAG